MRCLLPLLTAIVLVACGGSSLNAATLLVQPGDLPAGFSAGTLATAAPRQLYPGLPATAQQTAFQEFNPSGSVTLFVYADTAARDAAYPTIAASLGDHTTHLTDIGEQSVVALPEAGCDTCTEIAFTRCRAIAHVRMFDTPSEGAIAYAKRLDGRLSEKVCP
jgi:hypothetical protein